MPRFILSVRGTGKPWFQILEMQPPQRERVVESVRPPSPSAGEAREIVAGPGGTFLLVASRMKPCESRIYRFRLTRDGHARGIGPVSGGISPALVAGLAVSPDGRRIAYATAPCAADPPRAALSVLDTTTGDRRTWTAGGASIIGDLVWARDSRTLGYTTAGVASPGDVIGSVAVHALDTDDAPGADLPAGRLLFRQPPGSGTVANAIMEPDGRTGSGTMKTGKPPATILFSFAEGRPMHVTHTIPAAPGSTMVLVATTDDRPRYACLNGIDAFGKVFDGRYATNAPDIMRCGIAAGY